jgi:ubiquinone/menaquinone biosynthesis C-methylase UbiE
MSISSTRYLKDQYGNAKNLDSRIQLHELYSTNKQDWHQWVFEQIDFHESCKIIEFGCGSGVLWKKNEANIQPEWNVTLTDFSEGMLHDAQENIGNLENMNYRVMDVQSIQEKDHSYDIAIANHMLYHVKELQSAISELHRILKPSGKLYSSTNGINHMKEIQELINEFDSSLSIEISDVQKSFSIENGEKHLTKKIKNVTLIEFESNLKVTEVKPLIEYIYSMHYDLDKQMDQTRRDEFEQFLEGKMKENGYIHITKAAGMFVAEKE